MKRLFQSWIWTGLVGASVLLARVLYVHLDVIPSALFEFQRGIYDAQETAFIVVLYWGVAAIVGFVSRAEGAGAVLGETRTFVAQLYRSTFSSLLASLVLFSFTHIFFDPNFVALQILFVAALHVLTFVFLRAMVARRLGRTQLRSGFYGLIPETLKYALSSQGSLVWLMAFTLVAGAARFKADKDFQNQINRIRNISSAVGLEWRLVDRYPGLVFDQPIMLRSDPRDGTGLFVLEREGRLQYLGAEEGGSMELLLDLSSRVGPPEIENGALGFALHPGFGRERGNGYVYIYYTDSPPGQQVNRLSRFDLSRQTLAERLRSESVLIEQERAPNGYHNGGAVEFGPDGFVYLAIGDAQDESNYQTISRDLLGGVLRIDVDNKGGGVSHEIMRQPRSGRTRGYMIPSDNPFVGLPDALEEFWALGLRNPFRMAFDPETGQLWTGDVGEMLWEEVNVIIGGGNYQHPQFEGFERTGSTVPIQIGSGVEPHFAYRHRAHERAIIGGAVYRGERHPELLGRYLFADNSAALLYALSDGGAEGGGVKRRALASTDQFGHVGIAAVVVTSMGEVLVATLGSKVRPGGRILVLERGGDSLMERLQEALRMRRGAGPRSAGVDYTNEGIRDTYLENCSRCHGKSGVPANLFDRSLAETMPDFSNPEWQRARTDARLREAIARGGEGVGLSAHMPPWQGVLDAEQIDGLVELIRDLAARPDSG